MFVEWKWAFINSIVWIKKYARCFVYVVSLDAQKNPMK